MLEAGEDIPFTLHPALAIITGTTSRNGEGETNQSVRALYLRIGYLLRCHQIAFSFLLGHLSFLHIFPVVQRIIF